MTNDRTFTIKADDDTLVIVINYETKNVEILNGAGKSLHIEGEIEKDQNFVRIDVRVDIRQ